MRSCLALVAISLTVVSVFPPRNVNAGAGLSFGGNTNAVLDAHNLKSHDDARLLSNSNVLKATHHIDPLSLRGLDNDVKLTKVAAKTSVGGSSSLQTKEGWMATLGGLVERAIAPISDYLKLVDRYQKWYRRYKSVKSSSPYPMEEALEILSVEYMKANERLANRLCNEKLKAKYAAEARGIKFEQTAAGSRQAKNSDAVILSVEEIEMVDFVHRALVQTISVLESRLADAIGGEVDPSEFVTDPQELEEAKKAMDRLKRTAAETARGILTSDIMVRAKNTALSAAAATMFTKTQDKIPALVYLAPLVQLLGISNRIPAMEFIMNPEFHSTMINKLSQSDTVFYRCKEQPGLRPGA